MKRFTNFIKESVDIEELEDYFLLISDTLSMTAEKSIIGSGDFKVYQFEWRLDFVIGEYNSIESLGKIAKCLDSIKELKTSQKRILEFDIEFKISDKLSVRLTPNTKSDGSYKFVVGQEWREVQLSYINIAKFFKDNGSSILDIHSSEDEMSDTNHIIIKTNADGPVVREFIRLLNDQLSTDKRLNREIKARGHGQGSIFIDPQEEKTFVEIINK